MKLTAAPVTPAPVAASPSTFSIYDENLATSWGEFSFGGSYDASTEESHSGSVSFKANMNGWGAVKLRTDSPGLLLTDLDSGANTSNVFLRFYVKGSGTANIRVKVNSKRHEMTISPQGQWMQVSLALDLFQASMVGVYQVEIQNKSSSNLVLYFDEIDIHHILQVVEDTR